MFKILQWNCQSIRSKRPELEFHSNNYDAILISETWLNDSVPNFKIKGFNTIRSDRTMGKGGGVAILVRSNIKYQRYSLNSNICNNIEACAVQLTWQGKSLILVSIYIPPNVQISSDIFKKFFAQFNDNILIGGDFNAHHPNWGNSNTCVRGSELQDAISQGNLITLNDGSDTYCPHWRNSSSAIDISLVNTRLYAFCEWHTLDNNWDSDHRPIEILLKGDITYTTRFKTSLKHHTVKTNWAKVRGRWNEQKSTLEELIYNNNEDIQTQYSSFVSCITSCVREETPGKSLPIVNTQEAASHKLNNYETSNMNNNP